MYAFPPPQENPHCVCTHPMHAFWCKAGHMMECHNPYDCDTAACGHLIRYDYTIEEVEAKQTRMLALMRAGCVPGYTATEQGQVIPFNPSEWTVYPAADPNVPLRWFHDSPDAGDPACLCSWCGLVITESDAPPLRAFATGTKAQEARFHPACWNNAWVRLDAAMNLDEEE